MHFQFPVLDASVHLNKCLVGDKLILPMQVLASLMSIPIEPPYMFRITSEHDRTQHVGVLEFSAPTESVYVPTWIMTQLNLQDGEVVTLDTIIGIPKLEFVQFQPDVSGLDTLTNAKETLQDRLQKFTILYEHECIPIDLPNGTCIQLTVVQAVPKLACLIDAEFKIDFLPPEKDSRMDSEQDSDPVLLVKDRTFSNVSGRFRYTSEHVSEWTLAGDGEWYASMSNPHPHRLECDIPACLESTNPSLVRVLMPGTHYLYVVGLVTVHIRDMLDQAAHHPAAEPQTKCPNCFADVPESVRMLHETRCARMNWYCTSCSKVCPRTNMHTHCEQCDDPVSDPIKHQWVCHAFARCICGEEVESTRMAAHRKESCRNRVQMCKWCYAECSARSLAAHEEQCGNLSTTCLLCKKSMARKRESVHMLVTHGKIVKNPR